ncbi:phosphonate C-P lyase system protein PhnG [Pollutimonas bauzanensis]|uniref:Alpha-D-ribose 1-methylphosphonate 5-triphosphate synthase subunit PhnG n=1 Tax=Pollutimonas bauzanensis TaxID=658167 RepID=A0A1M5MDD9_9BURK|nr:phosphonate C-P lyase system protein PhnG [Pollutimonas bauzanensis]SHG75275.1 alpha-D-ribose 1-methylphosphonate 5-triphosphate synthase subunit PhnG [Pollutimonas bauzanensis]
MNSSVDSKGDEAAPRQQWMGVLARAGKQLDAYGEQLRAAGYRLIRPPEIGMVMVRGRMGASGAAFNLGEMTVTRCVVQLDDGCTGHSYVAGRNKPHAELAALADAHLQGASQQHWLERLIVPLAREQSARRGVKAAQSAATKVDFMTLRRGED